MGKVVGRRLTVLASESSTESHGDHSGGDTVHLSDHESVVIAGTHLGLSEHHILEIQSGDRKFLISSISNLLDD